VVFGEELCHCMFKCQQLLYFSILIASGRNPGCLSLKAFSLSAVQFKDRTKYSIPEKKKKDSKI